MDELLEILEENSRYTDEQLAEMTQTEDDYFVVNWDNEECKETITALIELKITPQRGVGFDNVAKRIYKFDKVKSCYLMSSGGFDLMVMVEGKSMQEIASFVSEKLACQEYVNGTATHFVLKKYKDHGTIFKEEKVEDREAIFI